MFKTRVILSLNIICVLVCFLIIPFILHNDIISNHDNSFIFSLIENNTLKDCGRIIGRFIVGCFYFYIPKFFNIHQNEVSSLIVPIITSLSITVMTIFSLKLFYLFSSENKIIMKNISFLFIYPAVFIINAFIPTINEGQDIWYLSGISQSMVFYEQLFNYLFFIIFMYCIISLFFVKRPIFINILYLINAILLGLSFEPLIFVSNIVSLFALIYAYILYRKNPNEENIEKIKLILLFFFGLFLSSSFLFLNSSYSHGKIAAYQLDLFANVTHLNQYFKEFFIGLVKLIIKDDFILLCGLFSCLLYILKYNHKYKNIIFILTLIFFISWILYFVILVIPGYVVVQPYSFWYSHPPFRILFFKTLFSLILLIVGYLIYTTKHSILLFVLILFSYGLILLNSNELRHEYLSEISDINNMRKQLYISDKIILQYNSLDGIALLPISYYEKYSVHKFIYRSSCYDSEENIRNKMKNIIFKEIEAKKSRLFVNWEENDYLYYIYNTYNIQPKGIMWVDDEIAFREFFKRGGILSEKELKNMNFTKLKRNNKNKYSLSELNSKITKMGEEEKSYLYAACAKLYEDQNNFNKAIENYTNAILTDKNHFKQYNYLRAETYVKANNLKAAEDDYIEFLKSSPYSIEVMRKLGDLYIKQEKYEKALNTYGDIASLFEFYNRNTKQSFYSDIANIQCKLKRYKDVINTVNKEEILTPYMANYHARAFAKIKLGDLEGAKEDFDKIYRYEQQNEETDNLKHFLELEKEENRF